MRSRRTPSESSWVPATAAKLKNHPQVLRESVRFVAEQDSLNASVLGPDAVPGTPEFDLFVKEVVNEMTVKAGQKCTAIRRAMVPAAQLDAVEAAMRDRLATMTVGDPREDGSRVGALVSCSQRDDVRAQVAKLVEAGARVVAGDPNADVGPEGGAFMQPTLLRADDPWGAWAVHDVEAFGPVSTLMPYKDMADAVALANRGMGSLALSLFTYAPDAAREFIQGAAAFQALVQVEVHAIGARHHAVGLLEEAQVDLGALVLEEHGIELRCGCRSCAQQADRGPVGKSFGETHPGVLSAQLLLGGVQVQRGK